MASTIPSPSAEARAVVAPPRWWRTGRGRAALWQAAAVLAALLLAAWAVHNAAENMAQRNIAFGFDFLAQPAGFDIPFRLLAWETTDSYARALLVALCNTLLVSALSVALATGLGLVLALMRLSGNPLASGTARGLVELIRNTPQLTQIVFWYVAVLQILPPPRNSLALGGAVLNVRGLILPEPRSDLFWWVAGAALLAAFVPRLPGWLRVAVPVVGVATAALLTGWERPELRGFNHVGGVRLPPELLALTLGVGIYTAGFVSENLRAAILGVPPGQAEAARSLGLSRARTMRLVVLPQALRTLIPPLTGQYLNAIKSSTLGAAIAFPEVLQIFARTVLNQSGRAIEVMLLVLGVFLAVNLLVSAAMARWNQRLARQGPRR